jgi:hypothetical protein
MNRIFRALAALALSSWPTVAAAQYQATVLADAPVAYYRFEEVAGTSALDSSGNGNTGTYTNGRCSRRRPCCSWDSQSPSTGSTTTW